MPSPCLLGDSTPYKEFAPLAVQSGYKDRVGLIRWRWQFSCTLLVQLCALGASISLGLQIVPP